MAAANDHDAGIKRSENVLLIDQGGIDWFLLDNIFGGGQERTCASGRSPITMALLGVLAYRALRGKGRLAEMLGRKPDVSAGAGDVGRNTGSSQGGGLGGLLGGLLGGGTAGGILSGGLNHLLRQFQQNGQDDKAQSWIANDPNKPVSPAEQALGPEKIGWLVQETRLSREHLLTD